MSRKLQRWDRITVGEAARIVGAARNTVINWCKAGVLPFVWWGGGTKRMVLVGDLLDVLNDRRAVLPSTLEHLAVEHLDDVQLEAEIRQLERKLNALQDEKRKRKEVGTWGSLVSSSPSSV